LIVGPAKSISVQTNRHAGCHRPPLRAKADSHRNCDQSENIAPVDQRSLRCSAHTAPASRGCWWVGFGSAPTLLAFFDGKIAKWWTPDDVIFVDAIPLGATGKMQKNKLREQFKGHTLPTA